MDTVDKLDSVDKKTAPGGRFGKWKAVGGGRAGRVLRDAVAKAPADPCKTRRGVSAWDLSSPGPKRLYGPLGASPACRASCRRRRMPESSAESR